MTPINAINPTTKTVETFTAVGQLDDAINAGYQPIRANGTPFQVQSFEGGHLLDGAPLNVWFGLGWYAGQQQELQPYWNNGQIPIPPQAQLAATTVPMPAAVYANWQNYMTQQESILGLPWWAWAAGAAAYLLLS